MQSHDDARRPEVVVYHSAYGLRPAIIEFGDKLRGAGHLVHTPDLYDGEVFSDRNDAIRKIQELGYDKLLDRALAAVEALPHDFVYAGFSNGGACAELLAATRPGARGAILIHAPLMVRDLAWTVWPWRLAALTENVLLQQPRLSARFVRSMGCSEGVWGSNLQQTEG